VKTASLSMLIDREGKVDRDLAKLRSQHEQTGRHLEESRTRLSGLDDYIERIEEVLGDPERHLRSSVVSLRLNKMNIKQDMDQIDAGDKIELTEISLGDEVRHIVMITKFSRSDLLPKTGFL
jgi:archaellum component FlaC